MVKPIHRDGIEQMPLKQYTEKAYLDYSMYVILDRALPQLADGLKPVQRRIIYAMSELGLKSTAKYKKSARTVGDVIGKFHPHGDVAAYEAMVLMAQPFSYRYPLVDGQGNWGAPDDPKSFAAMRYTESKLSAFAQLLLAELGHGTVNWVPNFDGSLNEPEVLPARAPTVLLNGISGIAVGMATDIPPHNLRELVNGCVALLADPHISVEALCEHIPGPDFPTGAEIITPKHDIIALYRTGRGSVRQRAVWQREDGDIVITALPHQTSGAKILEQIGQQMQAKKLPMVVDLRDESDHENPTRLVIVLRSQRVDVDALMGHLFAATDLERSYRVNLNMIGIDGKPQVKPLPRILIEWLTFRRQTVERRLRHRLDKVLHRLHLLAGLLIAFLNIDEVIAIIRTEDQPKAVLIERFALSEQQADYILDTRLRQLARLEEVALRREQSELEEERVQLERTLGSNRQLKALVKKELLAVAEEYGDERRSPLVARSEAKAFSEEQLVSAEPVTVILSEKGWIRAAKGHDIDPLGLHYKAGDGFKAAVACKSNQSVVILDSSGRAYTLAAHSLASARGQGEPLTGRVNPPAGAQFQGLLAGDTDRHYLLASDAGYGFIAKLADLISKNRAGKVVLTVPAGSEVLAPVPVIDAATDSIALVTSEGRLLLFPAAELPLLARGKGNKMIAITPTALRARQDFVVASAVLPPTADLRLQAGKRHLTLRAGDLEHYRGKRGQRGRALPRGFKRVDGMQMTEDG